MLRKGELLEATRVVELAGGQVRVRPLSLVQLDELRLAGDGWSALLFRYGLADPELTAEEAEQLAARPSGALRELQAAILDVSGVAESGFILQKAVDARERAMHEDDLDYAIHRLAHETGHPNVRALRAELTTADLIGWLAYWKLDAALRKQAADRAAMKGAAR
jgi:hypothetical protein